MDHRGGRFGGCGGAGLGWGGRCFPGFSWRFLGVKGHLPLEGDRDHGEGCWILFASNSCLSLMFLWSLASSGTFICVFLGGWTWHPAISTGTYAVWGLTKLGQWLFCVVLLVVWNPRDYRYMRFFSVFHMQSASARTVQSGLNGLSLRPSNFYSRIVQYLSIRVPLRREFARWCPAIMCVGLYPP